MASAKARKSSGVKFLITDRLNLSFDSIHRRPRHGQIEIRSLDLNHFFEQFLKFHSSSVTASNCFLQPAARHRGRRSAE